MTIYKAWEFEEDSPDPVAEHLPEPLGWKVIIRPLKIKEVTKGGIIRPEISQEHEELACTVGKVLAIGKLAWSRGDMVEEGPWAKVGDIVMYPKYGGSKIEVDGIRLIIVNDDELICRIPDPDYVRKL